MTTVRYGPDYSGTNPYQRLLAEALSERGVDAEPVDRHDALMPLAALRGGRPDVLHVHWLRAFVIGDRAPVTALKGAVFLSQLALLSLLGVRVIWTAHNVLEHDPQTPRLERVVRHLLVRVADAVVVHCPGAVTTLVDAYRLPDRYRDRFVVVPHGHYDGVYEDEVTRREAHETLGLDDPSLVVCFFGRVAPYKNVPRLVRAFRGLDREDAALVVAGRPTDRELARAIRSAVGSDDRVRLDLSFVPPDRVQVHLNAADVVVLPFEDVLTSGSVVTAMSFGLPVLIPDVGCSPAFLPSDGGFCYEDDGTTAALRAALSRVASDPTDLSRVGAANRRAIRRFGWSHVAARTKRVYEDRPQPSPAFPDERVGSRDGAPTTDSGLSRRGR